ncbi:YaaW family protein [Crocosphaera sp. UHCC 0190]|uniref:YaaW family protein n=1 Tax=Crocosphaera sp. UHCC 0190 TaxID=3110246 RepID=UPI002B21EAF0|nr:YaaW family protein [Crocosphaera sp. UHCC 0190]MEA5510760.1 YaaW family protein [Crocosphaera sp. UHCC 0190]
MDELRSALELATEDELRSLTQILFSRKFNPLDYLQTPDPIEIQSQDWETWLDAIEQRFRYLAADGLTVLQRKTQGFSYRQTLIRVCHYLKIPYSNRMSTTDIEADIFLNLVGKAWKNLPEAEQTSLMGKIQQSLAQSHVPDALPVQLQHNPVNLLLKGSSALAVSSVVKPWLLKQIAEQFALHVVRYQVAQQALIKGGTAVANQVAVNSARRGMAMTAARYGAVRSLFAFVGPVLWGWFLADLGWRAIATNYGRIIPVIFALAQIRLTRTECWEPA